MRNCFVIGALAGALLCASGCTTPVPPSAAIPIVAGPGPALNDQVTCRQIVGQANIDGTPQQIVGRACQQPDGNWQVASDDAVLYSMPAYPYYDPWYDPWYVWPASFGFGGSIVFVDHFHHFHHFDHVRYGGPSHWHGGGGGGGGGGFHGGGGMHGGGMWSGGGGMRR